MRLHGYFRSSASYRVRIALNLKGLSAEHLPHHLRKGEQRDPRGPSSGTMRIVRGGSWVNDDVSMLRCAYRHKVPPDTYAYSVGFRIACAA